ncbi:MAG: restriction endonuclease [Fimbriimonadaceae bacterium]
MRVLAPLATPQNGNPELERQVLQRLRWLSFAALEVAVQMVLKSEGYRDVVIVGNRHWRGRSRFGGVDLRARRPHETGQALVLIQVKDPKAGLTVQRRFIDELRGAMLRYGANQGIIVSTGPFSRQAVSAAERYLRLPVRLIDGRRLAKLMIKNALGVRIKPLVVHSLPTLVVDELYFERLEELGSQ